MLVAVFVAALILLCGRSLSSAGGPAWGRLDKWVGKYPTDRRDKQVTRLLELDPVNRSLRAVLSHPDLELLMSYTVEKPVEKTDRFIVVQQCMPHNCPAAHAMVVLDTVEERLWVGLFERGSTTVSTRWYGTDDYWRLPMRILRTFRRGHGE